MYLIVPATRIRSELLKTAKALKLQEKHKKGMVFTMPFLGTPEAGARPGCQWHAGPPRVPSQEAEAKPKANWWAYQKGRNANCLDQTLYCSK